jgi:hypothetical protein
MIVASEPLGHRAGADGSGHAAGHRQAARVGEPPPGIQRDGTGPGDVRERPGRPDPSPLRRRGLHKADGARRDCGFGRGPGQ